MLIIFSLIKLLTNKNHNYIKQNIYLINILKQYYTNICLTKT